MKLLLNIFAVLALLICLASVARADKQALEGVSFQPFRLDTGAVDRSEKGRIDLNAQKITFSSGKSLEETLRDAHIVPDNESYGLIYRLNPGISDLSTLATGTQLTVPLIKSGSNMDQIMCRIRVDDDLKSQIASEHKKLDHSIEKAKKNQNRFKYSLTRGQDLSAILASLATASADIVDKTASNSDNQPVSRQFLTQVQADLATGDELISSVIKKSLVTDDGLDKLASVTKDLSTKSVALGQQFKGPGQTPSLIPKAKVTVKLICPANSASVHVSSTCRVHFANVASYGQEDRPFLNVSEPAVEMMEQGNYKLWAQREADQKVVSQALEVDVTAPETGCDIVVQE